MNGTYDSELKKEVYKGTTEYKNLLDSLKKIKSDYLNTVYYEFGLNKASRQSFQEPDYVNSENEEEECKLSYNSKRHGFVIKIGEVVPFVCGCPFCPKVINQVEFSQLNIEKKYDKDLQSQNSYYQYIFLPMDESNGLEIENNKDNIEILRVFDVKTIYTHTYRDEDYVLDNPGKTCKVNLVKAGNLRLLIYNKVTNKIYYDKIYTEINKNAQPSKTKNKVN